MLSVVDFKRPRQTREPSTQYLGFLAGISNSDILISLERLQARQLVDVHKEPLHESVKVDYTKLLHWIERNTQPPSNS